MKRIKFATVLGIILFLARHSPANVGPRGDLGHPVAIDRASDSEFYVLSGDATIRRLRVSENGLEQDAEFSIQGFPIDFTYSVSEQVPSLFVCGTLSQKSVISRYSTDGVLLKRWWLWHTCGGIDFDYVDHALYIASSDTNEIYRLDISKNDGPKSIGELRVSGEIKIGPIAVDSTRGLIYASDLSMGIVYEYDPGKHATRVVASNLGLPVSLYCDSSNRLLYVADSAAKRILYLSLNPDESVSRQQAAKSGSTNAKITVVVEKGPLANPSGVVPAGPGLVAACDFLANKVFVLSLSGQVKFQYPP